MRYKQMKLRYYLLGVHALLLCQSYSLCLAQTPTQQSQKPVYRKQAHKPIKGRSANPANSPAESAYSDYLQQLVWPAWTTPQRHQNVSIVASFKLDRNGNISDLTIKQSSGNAEFDNSTLEAVRSVAPFKPLPASTAGDAEVDITFWEREDNAGASVKTTFQHPK